MATEFEMLGKVIGTFDAWDITDTTELMFYEVELNDLGKKFMPDFTDGYDLCVNFQTGRVTQYDPEAPDELEGDPKPMKVDWSVFNEG